MSTVPPFPITTGGFQEVDSKQFAARTDAEAQFLTRLYGGIIARNADAVKSVVACASTPFQKALGTASLEHLAIQASDSNAAEQFANQMPEADSNCLLAKAEALNAAAVSWAAPGVVDRAAVDFEAASVIVRTVPDLPFGKVSVALAIAAAQFKAGMASSSAAAFQLAIKAADELPVPPEHPMGFFPKPPIGVHYREEAYKLILLAAIRAHNLGVARDVADHWQAIGKTEVAIAQAWWDAGLADESLAFARKTTNPSARASVLYSLANKMLQEAGAPNF